LRPSGAPRKGGVCILSGSRPYEVRYLTPFFIAIARRLRALRPSVPITFVISRFTTDAELRAGVEHAGDPKLFGVAGRYDAAHSSIEVDGERFAVERSDDYSAMGAADLVITIPGTKCIEAAVLGRALLVVIPLNRLDEVAMNGVAAYLHLIPLAGRPLKNWLGRAVARRHRFLAQPNIDAGRMIAPEIRGILRPQEVAEAAAALLDRPDELHAMGSQLAALYDQDAGAATRMASDVLQLARREPAAVLPV
jgi:lipid A disaccharide synthetase